MGSSAAFFDGDNDGWLDLYVANYVEFSVDKNPWCGESISGLRAYCDPDFLKELRTIFTTIMGMEHSRTGRTKPVFPKIMVKGLVWYRET